MKTSKHILLLNALGIQDSGGLSILEKVLHECSLDVKNNYYIVCNNNIRIVTLIENYKDVDFFKFYLVKNRGFIYRLYYENFIFPQIIKRNDIKLTYNFSGTSQYFSPIPQLVKIQNLMFYSKNLDTVYLKNNKFFLWIKQIYLKRLVFKNMSNRSKYLEVQSSHVKECMSDFIEIDTKTFFIKSDIDVGIGQFSEPKKYNFTQKIKFLYIVGPHFEYVHKNFVDFTNVMLKFKKFNIDFEINVTLTQTQLMNSDIWDVSLNEKTNFLGYISDTEKMNSLFCNNTILVSTSIIETLGLHVVEAIKKGVIPIVPSEKYASSVYGNNIITYELFNVKSLLNAILSIINNKINCSELILTLQDDLKKSENTKVKSIVDIFQKVIDVQK